MGMRADVKIWVGYTETKDIETILVALGVDKDEFYEGGFDCDATFDNIEGFTWCVALEDDGDEEPIVAFGLELLNSWTHSESDKIDLLGLAEKGKQASAALRSYLSEFNVTPEMLQKIDTFIRPDFG